MELGRTGLIPASYADQGIMFRIPYSMPGAQLVDQDASGVFFPEATFLHNVDKPFEIWRMSVRIVEVDTNNVALTTQPDWRDLSPNVRLTITDTSKNESLTKATHNVATLVSSYDGDKGTWEWSVPYTLVRSEGLQVGIDTDASPGGGNNRFRIDMAFQGFLVVIQPASETR